MSQMLREVDGRELSSPAQFLREVVESCVPVVMRGLVSGWPAVHAATRSAEDFQRYLAGFDNGGETEAFVGDPKIAGKYYYAEDLKGFNFERRRMRFVDALSAMIATHGQSGEPTMYVGSVPVDDYLPGFAAQNVLQVLAAHVAPRIWLGHSSNVSAHFDAFDNVACVVAGSRRFTLFPPGHAGSAQAGQLRQDPSHRDAPASRWLNMATRRSTSRLARCHCTRHFATPCTAIYRML